MFRELLVTISILLLVSASNVIAGKGSGSGGDPSTLSEDEMHYLEYMRLEEKFARDVYITFYGDWGNIVFDNISESEQQHTDAVENLLDKYGLLDPVEDETVVGISIVEEVSDETYDEFKELFEKLIAAGTASELAALNVGGLIEEKDMVDIQKAIDAITGNEDIKSTYESLLCGSRNHLRAFVANIEALEEEYEASIIYLSQNEVDAITSSDMERCGNGAN